MEPELNGVWRVRRAGGLVPPLPALRKRIDGDHGRTELGPLRAPFAVEGRTLRYRWPLRWLVDELAPAPLGYAGRALLAGREYGRFRLEREDDGEETTVERKFDEQLARYLDEALAMEQNVVRMLDSVIYGVDDAEVKDALRHHKIDSERHVDRLRERLEAHGRSPSLVREAGGILGAMMKSVLDLTRTEKAARGIRDAYATEHMEIAAYELLERVALRAGDEETARVARENRADEERMAAWIADNWDRFADMALAEAALRA